MDYVNVMDLDKISEDQRGCIFQFSLSSRSDVMLITRKKGSMSGNFYHKGVSRMVNPKLFVLLSGSIRFNYRHIDVVQHVELFINKPSLIEVLPYVTHSIECVEDSLFLECNSIADIENDRYRDEVVK